MTKFTQHDRHLWGALIAVVASERVTDVARIHKAAKRAGKAVVPAGWCFPGSCFHVLVKDGKVIKGNDPVARAVLRTHAEACRLIFEGLDQGWVLDPEVVLARQAAFRAVKSPPSGCAGVPPASQGDMDGVGRKFRADIDG